LRTCNMRGAGWTAAAILDEEVFCMYLQAQIA
jgi:hypothetical protein